MPPRRRAAAAPRKGAEAASVLSLKAQLEDGSLDSCLRGIADAGRHEYAEQIKVLGRKQLVELCAAVQALATPAVELIIAPAEEEEEEEDESELVAKLDHALQLLRGSAILLVDVLTECHADPPEQLTQTVTMLHDNCLLAMEDIPELQELVSRLCCRWLELGAPHHELVAAQALPHLLARASSVGRAMDIKLCYALREGFTLFDYDDDSSTDTKRLMLQAAMNSAFLHRPEGRKFLSFLFRLHGPLVQELTAVLKNQIPSSRKALLDAYGDIIMRAWRDSVGGPLQYDIEAYCVQDLMRAAIHASTAPLGAALRHVLGGLHSQKKMAGVEAMLCRLYEPILFRAFGAANPDMRRNALLLLLDAFPIRDPDAPAEEMDESMTHQFQLLQQCLADDCPLVREVAARGVLALLNSYWELIPAAAIAVFLTKLTSEVAFDMSWPGVRVAVLECVAALVDNPHAQPVLKKALPHLATLLGDPVLKVREAMASLLVAVSRSRSLHFYEVVPLDALLSVMAVDAPSVSAPIQAILLPSYFPTPQEGAVHVVNLLKAKPQAGQAFCRYLVSSLTGAVDEAQGDAHDLGKTSTAVPVEHILSLVNDLMGHMLATCTNLQASPAPAVGPSKKQRGQGGKATTAKKAATGSKRRKTPTPPPGTTNPDEAVEAVEAVEDEPETPDTWAAWASGLALLCKGLACAVQLEQCGVGDVAAVLEGDVVLLLYEAAPNDAARCSILQVAIELPFLRASAALRNHLLTQLASPVLFHTTTGTLGGQQAPGGGVPTTATGPAAASDVTSQALRCVCALTSGQRLVAMLLKALGRRDAATVHVPVGTASAPQGAEGDVTDVCCGACGQMEPEEHLLMCDGCDSAYHFECVRPTITGTPAGDWFCHTCEQEVQGSRMTPAAAMRYLECVLSWPEGRQLLHSHNYYLDPLLMGLQEQAGNQCQRLVRQLGQPPAAPAAEAAEVVVEAAVVAGGKAGGKRGRKNKKDAPAAPAPEAPVVIIAPTKSWGVTKGLTGGASAVSLYCKTGLHMALARMFLPPPEEEQEDEEEEGEEGEGEAGQGAEGRKARVEARQARAKALRDRALQGSMGVLTEAQDLCEQVLEAVPEGSACSPALLHAALLHARDVLGVLVDAHGLSILDVSHNGNAEQVQRLCGVGGRVLSLCGQLMEARELEGCPEDLVLHVRGAVGPVLQLCTQLVQNVGSRQRPAAPTNPAGADATGGADGVAARLELEDPSAPLSHEALSALDTLVGSLLDLTLDPAVGPVTLLVAPLKQHMATLMTALVDPACRVPRGWLSHVLSATGSALQEALLPPSPGPAALPLSDITNEQPGADGQQGGPDGQTGATGKRGGGRAGRPPAAAAPGRGRKRGAAKGAAAAVAGDEAAGVAVAAEAAGDGEAEGQEVAAEQQGAVGGEVKVAGAEVVGGGVLEGGPVVAMLLAACKGKTQQEVLLDQLARVACEGWQGAPGLGALAMMRRLGVQGLRARRLRLTGSEANLLIKLDMLEAELLAGSAAAAAAGGAARGTAGGTAEEEEQEGRQVEEEGEHAAGKGARAGEQVSGQAARALCLLRALVE